MISENLWPTAILWLLKSMSEHVITMVDEETNKISSNLSSCSKVSMHFHFSSSGPRRSNVVVDDTSTNTNNENKHRLRATNYLDSVYWSYLRQLITMERSARQMRGRWAPSKGPAVGSASNLADGDTRDTLARLSFLPASPTPDCWSSDCVLTDGSLLLLTIHTTCTSAATLALSVKHGFSDVDDFPWQPNKVYIGIWFLIHYLSSCVELGQLAEELIGWPCLGGRGGPDGWDGSTNLNPSWWTTRQPIC